MAKYIYLMLMCFFLHFSIVKGLQTVNGRIKITVGTTSGSGATVRFMTDLLRVYKIYGNFLDIEFIPWGRTRRNDDGSLTCDFGPYDCWANRLHRCALNRLQGNQDTQIDYMNCEFSYPYPAFLQGSYICPHAIGLSIIDVDYCVNHPNNDDLDVEAEKRSLEMIAAINEVPLIVFNDEVDLYLHSQSLSSLESMICVALAADPTSGITNCTS